MLFIWTSSEYPSAAPGGSAKENATTLRIRIGNIAQWSAGQSIRPWPKQENKSKALLLFANFPVQEPFWLRTSELF